MAVVLTRDLREQLADLDRDAPAPMILRSRQPVEEAYLAVRQAAETVLAMLENKGLGDFPYLTSITPTPGGVGLLTDEGEDVGLLLEPFVRHLNDAGIEGVIDVLPWDTFDILGFRQPFSLLGCRVAIKADQQQPVRDAQWVADRTSLASIVRYAVRWANDADDVQYAGDSIPWRADDPNKAEQLLMAFLTTTPHGIARIQATNSDRFKYCEIAPWLGHATLTIGPLPDAADPPGAELHELTQTLVGLAAHITYGFIKRTVGDGSLDPDWATSVYADRNPLGLNAFPGIRRVEDSAPINAFGIQYLANPVDTSQLPPAQWTVEPRANGAIITATDPRPWFSTDTTDPVLMRQLAEGIRRARSQ